MDASVVGRDGVLDEAWRVLAADGSVLVEGPAGIGKTAIWRSLVGQARRAGWLVLTCAPTEAEAALPFAALADVLRPLAASVPSLPPPQRLAADVVLLAAHPDPIQGGPTRPEAMTNPSSVVDERAIGAAVRSLLESAVAHASGPVLLAVDDAVWLDQPSEQAMRFALRRLSPRLATLVTRRCEVGEPPPLGLDDATVRIGLAPLGVGALQRIVRDRLGRTLGRPLLTRIAHDAAGNPLLAIELARAVLRLPRPPQPGEDLPVVASMQHLVTAVLRALPRETREAVRLAALLTTPRLHDLRAAGPRLAAFDPAEEAGVLTVTATGVEFAHPVYATAIRARIPAGIKRRLHRRLVEAVTDPDERARQLAHAAVEQDAAVAAELSRAAQRQQTRGAPAAAAELYERAVALTPQSAPDDRVRLRLAAIRCRFDSGDFAVAGAAADAAAAELVGESRAEALLLRAMVAFSSDDLGAALSAAERGLAAAPVDGRLAGRMHAYLSLFNDAPEPGRLHAEAAAALLSGDDQGDRVLLCASLLFLFLHEVRAGRPPRIALLDRAVRMEAGEPGQLAGTIPAIWWKAIDDHDRARRRLHAMLGRAAQRGDEPGQHDILAHLGEAELLAGRFATAGKHIDAARELGQQLGSGLVGETWLAGTLDAYQGRLTEAEAIADAGLRRARRLDDAWGRRLYLQLAGLVALSAGRSIDAATAYRDLAAMLGETGYEEPLSQRFEPDWIEACVSTGDVDTARLVLSRLARRHERLPRPWTTLGLARSRVLLASATGGDVSAELSDLAAARACVPVDVVPLDRARCLLVAGMAHRRARGRREAREALDAAIAEFSVIGAAAFVSRARTELSRIGGRAGTPTTLTATEQRIAQLAAQGHTNRVIANTLFISPKTVEANLARAYRKLGVHNRVRLGAAITQLAAEESPSAV